MEASSFLMVLKKIIRKSEIVLIITYLLTGNGGSEPYHRNHFYRDEKKSWICLSKLEISKEHMDSSQCNCKLPVNLCP